jgi:cell division transport system permease protein
MIRHIAFEGALLLRRRIVLSAVLAFALAIPISLAGFSLVVGSWLRPLVEGSQAAAVVSVMLRPGLDDRELEDVVERIAAADPEWQVAVVDPDELVARLGRWFPYLVDFLRDDADSELLPPLLEVTTMAPDSLDELRGWPSIVALGPRSSIQRRLGNAGGAVAWACSVIGGVLLAAAVLLASVWVHLEIYRHGDEITIMRLVGATEGAIRGPFLVAVAAPGLVAALLATLCTWALASGASGLVQPLGLPPFSVAPWVLMGQALAAVALPLTAAGLILARHADLELTS